MKEIRNECPWDAKQTHESLKRYLLEETYETLEAIDNNHPDELKKELGDLLLQIAFHSEIASEKKHFDFNDVAKSIADKMYERHPHVFQTDKNVSADEVQKNWETAKHSQENRASLLSGLPKHLPALLKAQRMQDKASSVGFDWENMGRVIEKIEEELAELKEALKNKDRSEIENEFGDVLFSLVNISRYIGVVSEEALQKTNDKFIKRFNYIEKHFDNRPEKISEATLEELEHLWQKSKNMV
jgi:MazG family protein